MGVAATRAGGDNARMPVLERESALAALGECAESAAGGSGRMVLVSGEAGAGKSTLLERFEEGMPDARWLHGACDGLSTPRSLGPLFDVAQEVGGDLLEACHAGASREELFRLFLAAIGDGSRPTIVAIEDVHWADDSTLDLLRFVGRRVRDIPVLLVCTYRDDELGPDHPLRLVVGELTSLRTTRRARLAPLSEHAVRMLAAGSDVDARELYRISGGNPFFVTEVLHAGSVELPESARDAVLARLARTSTSARRIAEAAALIGAHVETWLLDAVASPTVQDLDELLASGLLTSDRVGLRFRHEIGRLAIEGDIPSHRCERTHRRVLQAMAEHGGVDAARLAHHAEGAQDAVAVRRYAPVAAEQASALGSHREAAAQYERAIRFSDENDAAAVAGLYDRMASEHMLADVWEGAAAAGGQALRLWNELGDSRRAGATMSRLARALWRLCRPEAMQYAEDALCMLRPLGATPELAWASATVAFLDSRSSRGHDMTLQARELAQQFELPDVLSDALCSAAWELGTGGDEQWMPLIQRALDVARAAEPTADLQVGRVYANLWELLVRAGRLAESERVVQEGIAYCDRRGVVTYSYCTRCGLTWLRAVQGRWDDAIEVSRPLWTVPVSSPVNRTMLGLAIGPILARRGDPAAWSYLDEVTANADGSGSTEWIVQAYAARAEAHWLAGDLEAARRDLAVSIERLPDAGPHLVWPVLAWCARLGLDRPTVTAPPSGPAALLLSGDFAGAANAWDVLGMPYEAAMAYLDSGSEVDLREAFSRFEALGATAAAAAARRELRRIGARSIPAGPHAATREHPLGLTRREAEVLDLIRDGRTNAQIAKRLFVSVRTVDHHVSAILVKLRVSTRQEAATAAQRMMVVV